MDSGGEQSVETFVPLRYIFLAKSGRFKKLAGAFLSMLRLSDNGEGSVFNAGTIGAYYVRLENQLPDGIYLVAPDNSFDFDTLEAMTVTSALEYVASYCDTHNIPKWTELAGALHDLNATISAAIGAANTATICGLSLPAADIPAWTDPGGSISILFRWIKQLVTAAETYNAADARQMTSYRSASNRYDIPIAMNAALAGQAISFSLDLYLLI